MTSMEIRLKLVLEYLLQQVQEDIPRKIMTKQLVRAIEDAADLCNEIETEGE